jgi:hypothetical protein
LIIAGVAVPHAHGEQRQTCSDDDTLGNLSARPEHEGEASMRIGPVTVRLIALLAFGWAGGNLLAQSGGAVQAMYYEPNGQANSYAGGYGNSAVVPASYCGESCQDYYSGGDCQDGYCSSDYGNCDGGSGCQGGYGCQDGCDCQGGGGYGGRPYPGGLVGACHNLLHAGEGYPGTNPPGPEQMENYSLIAPCRTEQCGPHYWDCRAEAVSLIRDKTFGPNIPFTEFGQSGPVVLSSNQLDYDYQTGFRVMGRYDLCPLSVLEFGYMGIFNWNTSAKTTDAGATLFSLFSDNPNTPNPDFGTTPAGVNTVNGPMPGTERSTQQSIFLTQDLQNVEMNYRRYWVGFSPCVSGTCLAGFRYTRLHEDFKFDTFGSEPAIGGGLAHASYNTRTENNLAGFQAGGDIWVHIWQGFRIGAEGKVGLCDNHYNVDSGFLASTTTAQPGVPAFSNERFDKDIPAVVTDASIDAVCDFSPSWSVRAGYELLFLNSVALAGDNFNTASPYQLNGQATRVPFVADQSSAFYHGFHLGFEYIW